METSVWPFQQAAQRRLHHYLSSPRQVNLHWLVCPWIKQATIELVPRT